MAAALAILSLCTFQRITECDTDDLLCQLQPLTEPLHILWSSWWVLRVRGQASYYAHWFVHFAAKHHEIGGAGGAVLCSSVAMTAYRIIRSQFQ